MPADPTKPPIKRHVGTDREALLAFVAEAASAGYDFVFVAQDVADALGAPVSTPITVFVDRYTPDGLAVAMPKMHPEFTHAR